MGLAQEIVAQNLIPLRIGLATGLLIEPLDDGCALVFDQSTGATTFINDRALTFLNLLCKSGVDSEFTSSSIECLAYCSVAEYSETLISLEKSKLVIRY